MASTTIILSKENASKSLVSWKVQVHNLLESTPLPKNFLETTILENQQPVSHPVDSLYDFVSKEIPQPQKEAYTDPKEFRINLQKYKQCVATIKVLMKTVLSNGLYEIFVAEEDCYEGMKAILLEVQYDQVSQLNILKRNLEMICQAESQSAKEYADTVNHIVLQLHAMGYPDAQKDVEFQETLSERFLLGMLPKDAARFRVIFQLKGANTFKQMRTMINEEAAKDELSRAQRQNTSLSTEVPSALLASEDLEARIFNIVKRALDNSLSTQRGNEESKIFVGGLSPVTTEEQLENAFKTFGQVLHTKILKNPAGESKRCGFVQFKNKFAADAALKQSGKVTVAGRQVITDVVKKGIKASPNYSRAHLSALVDSGCSPSHLTGNEKLFNNTSSSTPFTLGIADGSHMISKGVKGDLSTSDGLQIKNVEVVSGLSKTLLSTYAFLKDEKDVWFKSEDMSVNIGHLDPLGKNEILAKGSEKAGLFELDLQVPSSVFIATSQKRDWELWHKRFMHHGDPIIKHTLESGAVNGFHLVGPIPPTLNCLDCIQGKMHRLPHPPSKFRGENLLGGKLSRVAVDILYMPEPSLNGARYVLGVTVVSANGFKICYPCKQKSEILAKLKFMKSYLENVTNEKISELVADQGGENMSEEVKDICLEAGIVLSKTGTEEHESNGQIENWWRVALDCWRSHQISTNCSSRLWADGLCYLAYIHNQLVHSQHSKTPYEVLTGQKPSVHDLCVFGCLAYAYVLPKQRGRENCLQEQLQEYL